MRLIGSASGFGFLCSRTSSAVRGVDRYRYWAGPVFFAVTGAVSLRGGQGSEGLFLGGDSLESGSSARFLGVGIFPLNAFLFLRSKSGYSSDGSPFVVLQKRCSCPPDWEN